MISITGLIVRERWVEGLALDAIAAGRGASRPFDQ
jgi:hypothetical protein